MNKQKHRYNVLVRFYKLSLRKLKRLQSKGINLRKQIIRYKRLLRLRKQLAFLMEQFKPFTGKIALAAALSISQVNDASAQYFTPNKLPGTFIPLTNSTPNRIPHLIDIDGDGDADILETSKFANDSIALYQNTGTPDSPQFSTANWQPFPLHTFLNGSTTYFGVYFAISDLDADSDVDILTIDKNTGKFIYYENTGTAQNPQFANGQLTPFSLNTTELNGVPRLADLDNDGDQDLMVRKNFSVQYYENTGTANAPSYTAPVQNPFGLQINSDGYLNIIDIDHDGDLDVLSSGFQNINYYENIGTVNAPNFQYKVLNYIIPNFEYNNASFADLDADGNYDIVLSSIYYNFTAFTHFERSRDMAFQAPQVNPFGLTPSREPKYVDIDADGDLDQFSTYNFEIRFRENIGTSTNPNFAPYVNNPFSIGPNFYYTFISLQFVDLDNDGDLDITYLTGAPYYVSKIIYLKNIGTAQSPEFAPPVHGLFGLNSLVGYSAYYSFYTFGDLDGDGDFDLLAGYNDDRFYFHDNFHIHCYPNNGTNSSPSFSTSTRIIDPFPQLTAWSGKKIQLFDADSDDDLDLFLNEYVLTYIENQGTSNSPDFRSMESKPFIQQIDPNIDRYWYRFADLNSDGVMDLIGENNDIVKYYEGIPCPRINSIIPDSICGSGAVNLQGTATLGTLNWYDAASGGNLIGSGTSVNIPNITQTTSFWVEATDNNCTSSRQEVVIAAGPCSQLRNPYCNVTLNTFNDYMACQAVSGATAYRFELDDGVNTYTYDSPTVAFRMYNIPQTKYGTTYQVRVAVQKNGTWGPYSQSCSVTTPLTKIKPWYCGMTVSPMSQYFGSYQVANATQYKFKLFDGTNTLYYTSSAGGIRLSYVPGVQINTTYSVSVSAKVNGTWSAYGNACNITSAGSFLEQPNEILELSDSLENELFFLYSDPNPNTGSFRLTASHPGEFQILNELGQLVKSLQLVAENDNSVEVIDLNPGVYFITGILNREKVVRKFIVTD